jgi:DNA-binding CsgD family transcriptional regulator
MARHLRRDHETPVLFVTRPGNSRMGHVALRLGASHLPWSSGDDVLALLAYLFLLPGEIETRVVPSIPAVHDLTPKESKLFRLRMDGTPREELVTSESRNTIRNQVRSVSKKLGDRSYASWPDIVGEHARRLRGNLIDEAPTDHLENRSARPGLGKARASRDSGVRRRHVADAKPEDGAAPGIRRVRRARRRR